MNEVSEDILNISLKNTKNTMVPPILRRKTQTLARNPCYSYILLRSIYRPAILKLIQHALTALKLNIFNQ